MHPFSQSGLGIQVERTLITYVTLLSLSFLIHKMRIVSGDCGEIKQDVYINVCGSCKCSGHLGQSSGERALVQNQKEGPVA